MKVLIENVGCHDTTSTIMELEQKELDVLIKFAKACAYEGEDPGMCLYFEKECFKVEEDK